jgi:hypothetical protein
VKAYTLPSWAPGQAAVGVSSAAGKNPRPRVAAAPSAALIAAPRRSGTHGPPDPEGRVAIGCTLGPSARGKGTAAMAALVRWLVAVQGIRRITGVTGTQNPLRCGCSNPGVPPHGPLAGTGEVRYTLSLGERPNCDSR